MADDIAEIDINPLAGLFACDSDREGAQSEGFPSASQIAINV
jgi:hypothetical protein